MTRSPAEIDASGWASREELKWLCSIAAKHLEAPQRNVGGSAHFEAFWQAYPSKVGKKPALALWRQKKLDAKADDIMRDVTKRKTADPRWKDGFVCNPCTYLRQERWADGDLDAMPARPAPSAPSHKPFATPPAPAALQTRRDEETARRNLARLSDLLGGLTGHMRI